MARGAAAPLRVGPEIRERVRWRDVDIMGIVYYGSYLRFIEAAETEFFRDAGFTYEQLARDHGVWIARVRLECEYRAPAKLDDEIVCRAQLVSLGGSSLRLEFPIADRHGTPLVHGGLVLAALDRATLRPTRLPAPLREALGRGKAGSED